MLKPQALWSLQGLTRGDLLTLIGSARAFQHAAGETVSRPAPLRGKNLALLSDDPDSAGGHAFMRAATSLGALVSRVRATEPGPRGLRDRAGLLGQLYDAIECQGLAEAELHQLGRGAGVPVFNGIATPGHALQDLAALMTLQEMRGDVTLPLLAPPLVGPLPADALARNHHHLLQAVLSSALV